MTLTVDPNDPRFTRQYDSAGRICGVSGDVGTTAIEASAILHAEIEAEEAALRAQASEYPTPAELRDQILATIRLGYARRGIVANVLPGSDHCEVASECARHVVQAVTDPADLSGMAAKFATLGKAVEASATDENWVYVNGSMIGPLRGYSFAWNASEGSRADLLCGPAGPIDGPPASFTARTYESVRTPGDTVKVYVMSAIHGDRFDFTARIVSADEKKGGSVLYRFDRVCTTGSSEMLARVNK